MSQTTLKRDHARGGEAMMTIDVRGCDGRPFFAPKWCSLAERERHEAAAPPPAWCPLRHDIGVYVRLADDTREAER